MFSRAARPSIPAPLIRLGAALLEGGLLVVIGAMLLDGAIQNADSEGPTKIPLRVGWRIIPIVAVAFGYAWQRYFYKRRYAFMIAGALVCALGGALREGIEPLQRFVDALRGFVLGAILMGAMMSIDKDSTALMEGGAQPCREFLLAAMLVFFGALPSAIHGGFVLALPTIILGIFLMIRGIRLDAAIVVPRRSIGAAFRVFLALLFLPLALGFLVVCPMISLGMLQLH